MSRKEFVDNDTCPSLSHLKSNRAQVREAIKFQYTDWAAEDDEAVAAEARFGRAADIAADSQFSCPLEDALGTLSGGDDSDAGGVHIFR